MTATTTRCALSGCLLPETADHATLHATSAPALLTTYAALTHHLHASEAKADKTAGDRIHAKGLRAQRDMVEAECLRRMGA